MNSIFLWSDDIPAFADDELVTFPGCKTSYSVYSDISLEYLIVFQRDTGSPRVTAWKMSGMQNNAAYAECSL